jgi:MFS family permease
MRDWAFIARMIWKATKYLFLIAFSGIIGANLGIGVGLLISMLTGEPGWVAHGRCAGWTLFVVIAAIGAPLGFVRFVRFGYRKVAPKSADEEASQPEVSERLESRGRSLLFGPLLGAFGGLILGGMVGGYLIALHFFAALSPLGPGGWWPILPLTFQVSAGGFSTKQPVVMVAWLILVGLFVTMGIILGIFCSVSWGSRRFEVFPSRRN